MKGVLDTDRWLLTVDNCQRSSNIYLDLSKTVKHWRLDDLAGVTKIAPYRWRLSWSRCLLTASGEWCMPLRGPLPMNSECQTTCLQVIAYMVLESTGRALSRVCLFAMLASFICGMAAVLLLWNTPYTNYNFPDSKHRSFKKEPTLDRLLAYACSPQQKQGCCFALLSTPQPHTLRMQTKIRWIHNL